MAENAPPATATPAPNGAGAGTAANGPTEPNQNQNQNQNGTNRGLPYYEKLRRDLRDTLQKKRLMDKSMSQLEDQIFRFEQSYLEETTAGNIIKGFDNYIKGSSNTSTLSTSISLGGVGTARRKAPVSEIDRVFSRSSASFMRDSPAPSSAQTTPSHAATPSSTANGPTGKPSNGDASKNSSSSKNKKKSGTNKDDDIDDGDKPPTKRLKISYGRD